MPHQVHQFICELLDLPPHRGRVIAPDVGGGFGARLIVYPEDVLIPLLALRFGRPVRWLEDRLEHMLTATQERTQTHTVEVGFDDEGRLLALRDQFVHDTGAYTPRGLVVPLLTASTLSGPYRIPNIEVSFVSVYTHRVPVTPYRGAGQPQAVFVLERVMDLIARETGRDRAAVRFANFVQPADMPYDVGLPNYRGFGNVIYDSGDYPAVLRRALEMSGWDRLTKECRRARQEGRLLGVGLACYVELTGVGPFEGATIRADSAGRITVFTGVPSQGQGLETTLAQVAADELGVTPDEVSVIGGDTLGIPQGIGTFASRAAVVGSNTGSSSLFGVTPRVLSTWAASRPSPPWPPPRTASRPAWSRRTTSSRPTSPIRAAPTWSSPMSIRRLLQSASAATGSATTAAASSTPRSSKARSRAPSRWASAARCSRRFATTHRASH